VLNNKKVKHSNKNKTRSKLQKSNYIIANSSFTLSENITIITTIKYDHKNVVFKSSRILHSAYRCRMTSRKKYIHPVITA